MTTGGIAIEHGASELRDINVDSYNLEIKKGDDWLGDQASRLAFWKICDDVRRHYSKRGFDPFDRPTEDVSKKEFDRLLAHKDPLHLAFAHSVVETFAQQLTEVIARFLAVRKWRKTEVIFFGGGLMSGRAGQVAMERAAVLLAERKLKVQLRRITHDPDDAGLIGAYQLFPAWMLKGHDALLGVDIGGTNIRAATLKFATKSDKTTVQVHQKIAWKQDKSSRSREAAVKRLAKTLRRLIKDAAEDGLDLAPVVGIACPGIINADGSIKRGAQNLPGNWESEHFNLAGAITDAIPLVGDEPFHAILHNDAVVQGLSEKPLLEGVKHWAILTIGTGLGNAKFSNAD